MDQEWNESNFNKEWNVARYATLSKLRECSKPVQRIAIKKVKTDYPFKKEGG